jgi:hypothetical protein
MAAAPVTTISVDDLSRTVLLSLRDGSQPSLEEAIAAHQRTTLTIVADLATCHSRSGQACLETAVACAVRAFGHVTVNLPSLSVPLAGGLHAGQDLADTLRAHGATLDHSDAPDATGPTLLIGDSAAPAGGSPKLRATWAGWTARTDRARTTADHASELDDSCILAPIAAGALGVSEAFLWTRGDAGSDAGYRDIELNLWEPGGLAIGPALAYAPAAWWLVGLGHLGQANAWVLSWLHYRERGQVEVVVQDIQTTEPGNGNYSTGLLVPRDLPQQPKTRLVVAALDHCGYTTRIVERRLTERFARDDADLHVALLGVDNLPTRRLTSAIGWHMAIDAGLGTALDYTSILIRRFPAAIPSHDVPSWQHTPAPTTPDTQAFADLATKTDTCGLAQVAGTAVGAVFVGTVTACLVIAEAVRELHGGVGHDVIVCDLRDPADIRSAPPSTPCTPVACQLT